jgi:hypothetical protein
VICWRGCHPGSKSARCIEYRKEQRAEKKILLDKKQKEREEKAKN